jgi:hypothetical protein
VVSRIYLLLFWLGFIHKFIVDPSIFTFFVKFSFSIQKLEIFN